MTYRFFIYTKDDKRHFIDTTTFDIASAVEKLIIDAGVKGAYAIVDGTTIKITDIEKFELIPEVK